MFASISSLSPAAAAQLISKAVGFNNNCDLFTKQRAAYMLKAKSEWALGEEMLACKSFQKAKTFRFPSKKDLESHIRLLAAANYKFDNQNIMQQSLKEYDYFKIRWQAFMQIEKNINAKKSMTKCQST